MKIKGIITKDFVNYKKPCMTIMFPYCNFKCDKECGKPVCQNSSLVSAPNIEVSAQKIVSRYLNNDITKAICLQGLEPFDSYLDLLDLVAEFRLYSDDDIVIYTGYTKEEIGYKVRALNHIFHNIIVKYGRFIPNQSPHYDKILGVNLASDNQYAKKYN